MASSGIRSSGSCFLTAFAPRPPCATTAMPARARPDRCCWAHLSSPVLPLPGPPASCLTAHACSIDLGEESSGEEGRPSAARARVRGGARQRWATGARAPPTAPKLRPRQPPTRPSPPYRRCARA
ncbi:hypothetical protein PR202_gb12816 [Eleusine coracana subsp. coracana]|uniref:Uncharacterized protein n=1 Tax=Eleusine coracana subsp. coracana TaxID=191504 RepID=A0AAV5ENR1_ELECO|nr:hypothetical protein PR202_gb12816 [Eleusine coracana subsp. coracana]